MEHRYSKELTPLQQKCQRHVMNASSHLLPMTRFNMQFNLLARVFPVNGTLPQVGLEHAMGQPMQHRSVLHQGQEHFSFEAQTGSQNLHPNINITAATA